MWLYRWDQENSRSLGTGGNLLRHQYRSVGLQAHQQENRREPHSQELVHYQGWLLIPHSGETVKGLTLICPSTGTMDCGRKYCLQRRRKRCRLHTFPRSSLLHPKRNASYFEHSPRDRQGCSCIARFQKASHHTPPWWSLGNSTSC